MSLQSTLEDGKTCGGGMGMFMTIIAAVHYILTSLAGQKKEHKTTCIYTYNYVYGLRCNYYSAHISVQHV